MEYQSGLAAGDVVRDVWELIARVYDGPMSEVWRARYTRPEDHGGEEVEGAVKIIADGLMQDETQIHRFVLGSRIQGSLLNHPNIIPIRDSFAVDDRYAVVMPWIDGPSLEQVVDQNGQLPAEYALDIAIPLLDALEHAHRRREPIIHRDIKPSNVLLDPDGVPNLTDFGIALAIGQQRLTKWGVVGTPDYIDPEQIQRPLEVDHRADIYSFGCMLFEMLTGKLPFDSHHPPHSLDRWRELQNKHIYENPPLVRAFSPEVPEELERVVDAALAKNPADRFLWCSDMREYLIEIRRLVGGREAKLEVVAAAAGAAAAGSLYEIRSGYDSGAAAGAWQAQESLEPPPPSESQGTPASIQSVVVPHPVVQPVSKAALLVLSPGLLALPLLLPLLIDSEAERRRTRDVMDPVVEVISFAVYLYLVYRAWHAISDEKQEFTPAAAVYRHFIPIWNFVWPVHAYVQFLWAYNCFVERQNADDRRIGTWPAVAWCLTLLAIVLAALTVSNKAGVVLYGWVAFISATGVLNARICDAINSVAELSLSQSVGPPAEASQEEVRR